MPNNVGRLGVVLGLNTAEFTAGIENAGKKLDAFVSKIGAVAKVGATALAAMSVAAIKFADDIADVAEANEVTIDTVVKLRSALQSAGGEADKAGVMLASFAKFIDNAASGSFEAQQAFKAVGVSLKDIGSMTQEQLLGKVLNGLAQMDDAVTRTAKSTEFFSKAAKGVAFDKFAQEMSKTTDLTRQQIEAVKAGAETWGNLENIIKKLQMLLVTALGPSLGAINNTLSNETYNRISMLGKVFDFLARSVYSTYKAMQSIVVLFEQLAGQSVIAQTYGESAAGMAETAKLKQETERRLAELRRELQEFEDFQKGNTGMRTDVYPKAGKPKSSAEQLRDTTVGVDTKLNARLAAEAKMLNESNLAVVNLMKSYEDFGDKIINIKEEERKAMSARADAEQKAAYQANEIIVNLQKRSVLDKEQLDKEREVFLLRRDNKHLNNTELEYAQKIFEIRNKYADEERNINEQLRQGTQEHNAALERNNELRQRSIDQAKEVLTETRRQTEGTFREGVGRAFDDYIKNIPTQLQLGQQAFTAVMGNMDMALQNFVRSGKFSFKDFTRSVIQDMILIQARAQMMSMMRGLYGLFGGGTPSVSLSETPIPGTSFTGFNGPKANGGSVDANKIGLVGERGPELFVPRTAGTIIPNNQLANAMGGGQTVNYNGPYIANMSAIDTQTGVQFLAKNKQTIWASYQSANRSVPVSR